MSINTVLSWVAAFFRLAECNCTLQHWTRDKRCRKNCALVCYALCCSVVRSMQCMDHESSK